MLTLNYWQGRLTVLPSRIMCPRMMLFGRRIPLPPVFEGPGYIEIDTSTRATFLLLASTPSPDSGYQLGAYLDNGGQEDAFRLVATDYSGTEWACGWTSPRVEWMARGGYPVTGEIAGIVTHTQGEWVSRESSVELVFQPGLQLPLEQAMVTTTVVGDKEVEQQVSAGRHTLHVLGSEITFFHRPREDSLWITATTSKDLRNPDLEHWLSEPLRVLMGQLIYPRLVARNLGDGSAHVVLRSSPNRESGFQGLIGTHPIAVRARFWELYAALLTRIALDKKASNQPHSESNPLTRFYEEISQASRGSPWVMCMTVASSIEGLLRLLHNRPTGSLRVETELKAMEARGLTTTKGREAWRIVRHAVTHGQLVSPWPTEEERGYIKDLLELLRALTRELVRPAPSQ